MSWITGLVQQLKQPDASPGASQVFANKHCLIAVELNATDHKADPQPVLVEAMTDQGL